MKRIVLGFIGAGLLGVSSAQAAYTVVDNFESLALGEDFRAPGDGDLLTGAGGWIGASQPSAVFEVGVDPTSAGNQVLNVYSNDANSNGTLLFPSVISDNTTGTIFMRVRYGVDETSPTATIDPFALWGLSHRTSLTSGDTANFSGTLTAYASVGTGQPDNNTDFRVRNGGSSITPTDGLDTDAWYNFWFVANATTDTYDVYVQSDDDSDYASQTQVASGAAFRNAGANDLSVIIKQGDDFVGQFWFDDIYVDASGQNLVNPLSSDPIPEPSTALLALIGGLAAFGRKRRG